MSDGCKGCAQRADFGCSLLRLKVLVGAQLVLLLLSICWAFPGTEVSLKGSFPGYSSGVANAIQTVGNLAYVAIGEGGLAIVNIADPAHPVRLGGYDTENYTSGLAIVGSLAYLADQHGGLIVVDVSNPSNPTRIGGYNSPNFFASDVTVAGAYAYVASIQTATNGNSSADEFGLHILDINNPANPAFVSRYNGRSCWVGGLALGGNDLAYLCLGYNGVAIIDVSDRSAPWQIARIPVSEYAVRVTISGNNAFIASRAGGMEIIDVTFPGTPVRVGRYDSTETYDVAVRGDYAFLADLKEGLQIVDITSAATPRLVALLNVPGLASALAVENDHAYVAAGTGGLRVIDASDRRNPRPIGALDTYWYYHQVAVEKDGAYAYVAADTAGVHIFDAGIPAQPLRIGNIQTLGPALDVAVAGQYLYVVEGKSGLEVFDIINRSAPTRVAHCVSCPAVAIAVSGDRAYLAGGESWNKNGLQVLDISDARNPTALASFLVKGNHQHVAVSGAYAYLIDQNAGLRIIDISFPLVPEQIESYTPNPLVYSYDIAVSGNHAFLAADALRVLDVRDPNNASLVTRSGSYYAPSIALLGQYALLSDYGNTPDTHGGLRIFSITNPAAPVQVASYEAPGFQQLSVAGNLVYVVNASHGLNTLELGSAFATSPRILTHPTEHAVGAGSSVTLEVIASGTLPLTYQWRLNGIDVNGATASRLTLTNVSLSTIGKYSVQVSNAFGVARSSNALVSLVVPPVLVSWTADQTVAAGSDVMLDAIAQGTEPLRYLWTFLGTNVQSSTEAPLELKDVQTENTGIYELTVANMAGKVTTFISLTVTAAPPTIILQPQNINEISGVRVIFKTESRGSNPLSYQWEYNDMPIEDQTDEDLVLDRIRPENSGVYRLRVTNALGQTFSQTALLRVQVTPDFNAAIGHLGTNQTRANAIAVDRDSNLFVAGQFYDRGVFGYTNVVAPEGDMFLAKFDASSNLLWIRTIGELLPQLGGGPDTANKVALDAQGDAYVVGSFSSDSQLAPNFYFRGAYLAKYYADGQFAWLQAMWGFDPSSPPRTNSASGVRVDHEGNILVVGNYENSAAFGINAVLTNAGGSDVFIAKYSPQAELLWARRAGGPGDDKGVSVDCDPDDNILFAGTVSFTTNGSTLPGLVSFGGLSLSNTGKALFVAKCDPNGNFLWVTNARSFAAAATIEAQGLATDGYGHAYIAGSVVPPAVFGKTNLPATPFNSQQSAFVAKYAPDGDCLWLRQIPSEIGAASASAITLDRAGSLFVGGKFSGEIFFGEGDHELSFIAGRSDGPETTSDGWIASYDFNGGFSWARPFGGRGQDALTDIAFNKNGDAYVAGFFTREADFGDIELSSRHFAINAFFARIDYATAPTAPRLSISRSGALLEIAWPAAAAGFDLQTFDAARNTAVVLPLSSSTNAVRTTRVVPALQGMQWFRLIKP